MHAVSEKARSVSLIGNTGAARGVPFDLDVEDPIRAAIHLDIWPGLFGGISRGLGRRCIGSGALRAPRLLRSARSFGGVRDPAAERADGGGHHGRLAGAVYVG